MMTEELKPCPLCGGKATVSSYSDETLFGVYCTSCTCRIAGLHPYYNIDSAIKAWNTRTNTFPDWLKDKLIESMINCILIAEELKDDGDIEEAVLQHRKSNILKWVLSLKPDEDES